jgi:hypothetical protein
MPVIRVIVASSEFLFKDGNEFFYASQHNYLLAGQQKSETGLGLRFLFIMNDLN